MMGPGRFGNLMNQETLKPRSLGSTLGRLAKYFGRFWPALVLALIFIVISTWTQVTTPVLTGEATDCFLVPLGASELGGATGSFASTQASSSAASCWLTADPTTLRGTQWLISSAYRLGGFVSPAAALMSSSDRMLGLGRLILILLVLFVVSSLLTGTTFYTMAWSGQKVLPRPARGGLRAAASALSELLRSQRGRRPDEPHYQ